MPAPELLLVMLDVHSLLSSVLWEDSTTMHITYIYIKDCSQETQKTVLISAIGSWILWMKYRTYCSIQLCLQMKPNSPGMAVLMCTMLTFGRLWTHTGFVKMPTNVNGVWIGCCMYNKVLGPVFNSGTLNAQRYLTTLQSEVSESIDEHVPLNAVESMWVPAWWGSATLWIDSLVMAGYHISSEVDRARWSCSLATTFCRSKPIGVFLVGLHKGLCLWNWAARCWGSEATNNSGLPFCQCLHDGQGMGRCHILGTDVHCHEWRAFWTFALNYLIFWCFVCWDLLATLLWFVSNFIAFCLQLYFIVNDWTILNEVVFPAACEVLLCCKRSGKARFFERRYLRSISSYFQSFFTFWTS